MSGLWGVAHATGQIPLAGRRQICGGGPDRALLAPSLSRQAHDVTSVRPKSTTSASRLTGNLQGMGWMLLASAGIAINNAFVRHLTSTGLSPIEIAFFVNLFGVLAMTPFFLYQGPGLIRTGRFGIHLLRAVCFFAALVLLYMALATTPLALVAALGFTMPIITTILAIVFFREVVRRRHWIAILIGFSGTFVILRPGLEVVELGSILVLLAACFLSIMTILAKLLARTDSSLTITAYTRLLPTPIAFIAALFVWDWPTWPQLGILALAGIVGAAASVAVVQAVKIGETNVVVPMDFSRLVWASLLGFIIFAEVPTVYTWIGGIMIFGTTFYIAYQEGEDARTAQSALVGVHGSTQADP